MSKELAKTYDPHGMEDRIYQKWLDKKYFRAEAVVVGRKVYPELGLLSRENSISRVGIIESGEKYIPSWNY